MEEKTNKRWYPYEEDGCFYRLEGGVLMQCPMLVDGTREKMKCEVDWDRGISEEQLPRMQEIARELQEKP